MKLKDVLRVTNISWLCIRAFDGRRTRVIYDDSRLEKSQPTDDFYEQYSECEVFGLESDIVVIDKTATPILYIDIKTSEVLKL